jgi:hypothetical protein
MGAPGSCIVVRQRGHAAGAAARLVSDLMQLPGSAVHTPKPWIQAEADQTCHGASASTDT